MIECQVGTRNKTKMRKPIIVEPSLKSSSG
jgi:hypothetical protein